MGRHDLDAGARVRLRVDELPLRRRCCRARSAWAVRETGTSTSLSTLVLRWTGTSWSRVFIPSVGSDAKVWAVTALSSSDAWAVGTADGKTLILHWNGTVWK